MVKRRSFVAGLNETTEEAKELGENIRSQQHLSVEPPSHSTTQVVSHPSGQVAQGARLGKHAKGPLKVKNVHFYTDQIAGIRRLAAAGKDRYGQGLSDSIIIRCAVELLLTYDLDLHPNMTEEELWQEIVKTCVRNNT